jgi:site-specific recombinase XerD
LILASGGMRITDAAALRNMDIDFETMPTKVKIRAKYAKTRVAREIYISDEATSYLKEYLEWKYNNPKVVRKKDDKDLIFALESNEVTIDSIYQSIDREFKKLLTIVKMDERKEHGIQK